MIVVDTNVASELMREAPSQAVKAWIASQRTGELCTTALTVAEIRYGLDMLPAGNRRDRLRAAANGIFQAFSDYILPFDVAAAIHYSLLMTDRRKAGLPISGFDAQIAAICLAHDAALATRDTRDFQDTGIRLIDPWQRF